MKKALSKSYFYAHITTYGTFELTLKVVNFLTKLSHAEFGSIF